MGYTSDSLVYPPKKRVFFCLKLVLNIYFIQIYSKNKRNWKKSMFFFIFLLKKSKNRVSELRPDFWKRLVLGKYWNYGRPLWESIVIKCTNLFPNFQRGTSTQKDKKSFQSLEKKRSQNFAFLEFLGYLIMLWPNASSNLPEILYASLYMKGAHLSQISA